MAEGTLPDRDVAPLGDQPVAARGDDEDEGMAAVDDDRLLGHGERPARVEHDCEMHEHAGRQRIVRVGDDGAGLEGARDRIDPAVDRLDRAGEAAAGEGGGERDDVLARCDAGVESFGQREFDLDERQIVERRHRVAILDARAEINAREADDAGKRRGDGAVAQPPGGAVTVGLCGCQLHHQLVDGGLGNGTRLA